MGSEKKYLSGHSRSAALGGRDYSIFGNNLLPILQAAGTGFPYFAERQACLYMLLWHSLSALLLYESVPVLACSFLGQDTG